MVLQGNFCAFTKSSNFPIIKYRYGKYVGNCSLSLTKKIDDSNLEALGFVGGLHENTQDVGRHHGDSALRGRYIWTRTTEDLARMRTATGMMTILRVVRNLWTSCILADLLPLSSYLDWLRRRLMPEKAKRLAQNNNAHQWRSQEQDPVYLTPGSPQHLKARTLHVHTGSMPTLWWRLRYITVPSRQEAPPARTYLASRNSYL